MTPQVLFSDHTWEYLLVTSQRIDEGRPEVQQQINEEADVDRVVDKLYIVQFEEIRLKGYLNWNGNTVPNTQKHDHQVPLDPVRIVPLDHFENMPESLI